MSTYKPVALIILDGWGIREMEHGNAIAQADIPNYSQWLREHERSILDASGEAVGLPAGQMGNSEVGHLNLGAGRIVYQDLTRINLAIRNDEFADQEVLQETAVHLQQTGGKLHLIGLFGPGGVHSHQGHLYALLRYAEANNIEPILHLITDGRDTPPRSALAAAEELESYLQTHSGIIASVSGRYYTMDRDKRWPRTAKGYRVMALHEGDKGKTAVSASSAIQQAYDQDITDEFILPVAINTEQNVLIEPGDCLLFYNFRADRMRQIVTAVSDQNFNGFSRNFISDLHLVTMTEYDPDYPVAVIFPPQEIINPLAEVISKAGRKQFHAAETEKYPHVTYFFNGGIEKIFADEERHIEPSPQVPTYDLQPEMSARPLTEAVLQRLANHDDDFILVNFANPDMVGHTGDLEAAIQAVEAVDDCAGQLVEAIVNKGGVALVTADHGNAERMIDETTGNPHTYHTTQPVSLIAIGKHQYFNLRPRGILADVAPTILELMGLKQPNEMTGQSLLQ